MDEQNIQKINDLEEFLKDDPKEVSEETAQRITEQLQPENDQPTPAGSGVGEAPPDNSMCLGDFAGIAVKMYESISDRIYQQIKGGTPPAWDNGTTDALTDAAKNCLKGYNVPCTPIWQLVFTIAVAEVVRYTQPIKIIGNGDK